MKRSATLILGAATALMLCGASPAFAEGLKIGLVNFKKCVEQSKLGKQEQANFENLKKQMEGVLEEKEKAITELSKKFNDPDYLDSLSPEAEAELKHKFRTLNQELSQHQQQFYQVLNQANYKIIQNISESIGEASKQVAKSKQLDLVINEEGTFFAQPTLDVSNDIVKVLDEMYQKEANKK